MSQVNGKLSSRVMNMKFMRFSKNESDEVPSDAEASKPQVHDSSQWSFKGSAGNVAKKSVKVKSPQNTRVNILRSNVSMTELKRDTTHPVVRGRRVIGENATPEGAKRERSPEDEDDDDEYDLDKVFKQIKTDKEDKKGL